MHPMYKKFFFITFFSFLLAQHNHSHDHSHDEFTRCATDELEQELHLPFVQVKSSSSGQQFRLFIRQTQVNEEHEISSANIALPFNSYGLNGKAILPLF